MGIKYLVHRRALIRFHRINITLNSSKVKTTYVIQMYRLYYNVTLIQWLKIFINDISN
jgi:hypothetical protein